MLSRDKIKERREIILERQRIKREQESIRREQEANEIIRRLRGAPVIYRTSRLEPKFYWIKDNGDLK